MKKTKRISALILALIFVLSAIPAFSEESNTFTFRNGITWGMNTSDILLREGNPDNSGYDNGRYLFMYNDRQVSDYSSEFLAYFFIEDSLFAITYHFGRLTQADAKTLIQAFSSKYGEYTTGGKDVAVKLVPGYLDSYHDEHFIKWNEPDGTTIILVWPMDLEEPSTAKLEIYYLSPSFTTTEEVNDINLTGV